MTLTAPVHNVGLALPARHDTPVHKRQTALNGHELAKNGGALNLAIDIQRFGYFNQVSIMQCISFTLSIMHLSPLLNPLFMSKRKIY